MTSRPTRRPCRSRRSSAFTRQVGVSLVTPGGRRLGWIVPPARATIARRRLERAHRRQARSRRQLRRAARLPLDGARDARRCASTRTAPQLAESARDNGSTQFAGDNQLLTTISPNGDGFRDKADVTFRLREPATVTHGRHAHRQGAEHRSTRSQRRFGRGTHTMTWAPAPNDSTRARTDPLHGSRPRRATAAIYGAAERVRRPRCRAASSCACRGSTRASPSRATSPGEVAQHPHRDRRARR